MMRMTANEAREIVRKAKIKRCKADLDKIYDAIKDAAEDGLRNTSYLVDHNLDDYTSKDLVEDLVDILETNGFEVNTCESIDSFTLKIYW